MNLSLELLQAFIVVTETMNFTKAASRLYKTQSAISLQMKRLSEEIGKPLFLQKGKKLSLTATGETLLIHAVKMLKVHDEACAALVESDLTGAIQLGASEDYADTLLPPILDEFAEKYPNVRVGLICGPSHALKEMLDDGLLDIAILAEHEPGGRLLKYESIVWLASKSYVNDNKEIALAVYPGYCVARNSALKSLTNAGLKHRIAYESESSQLIKAAVQSGRAVAPVLWRVKTDEFNVVGTNEGFPELPHIPITLHKQAGKDDNIRNTLEDYIVKAFATE